MAFLPAVFQFHSSGWSIVLMSGLLSFFLLVCLFSFKVRPIQMLTNENLSANISKAHSSKLPHLPHPYYRFAPVRLLLCKVSDRTHMIDKPKLYCDFIQHWSSSRSPSVGFQQFCALKAHKKYLQLANYILTKAPQASISPRRQPLHPSPKMFLIVKVLNMEIDWRAIMDQAIEMLMILVGELEIFNVN